MTARVAAGLILLGVHQTTECLPMISVRLVCGLAVNRNDNILLLSLTHLWAPSSLRSSSRLSYLLDYQDVSDPRRSVRFYPDRRGTRPGGGSASPRTSILFRSCPG